MEQTGKIIAASIIFDWGNTLVFDPFDSLAPEVSHFAVKTARDQFDCLINYELFLKNWSTVNTHENFPFASHFSQEEPFIQSALRKCNFSGEVTAILAPIILVEYRKKFKELLINNSRNVEIKKTLEEFKKRKKKLAVLSNDRIFTLQSTLSWMGIKDLFDHLLTSEEIGVEKPNPEVVRIASERFGDPISEIVYVGDDPIRDVQCAHDAGAKAILYVPPEEYKTAKSWRHYDKTIQDPPDASVEEFENLLDVIV